jgi:DNA modification methylase
MFPLSLPVAILKRYAKEGDLVGDPFCGRGTTNYAARLLGLPTIGMDSNEVAVAISKAKLINPKPNQIVKTAEIILTTKTPPSDVPSGEFWRWAFHKETLNQLCLLREELKNDCRSVSRIALRAIILGALHGPVGKTKFSYFSNQSPRSFAPKPKYAVKYWKAHKLKPQRVDLIEVIRERAHRYYSSDLQKVESSVFLGDSREEKAFSEFENKFDWIITSPPYYGMRTYRPDQWLRLWFLGGSSQVDYTNRNQIDHTNKERFVSDLNKVWKNLGKKSHEGTHLVCRFGSINDRDVEALHLFKNSIDGTNWRIQTIKNAGSASKGRKQASYFLNSPHISKTEYDIWAIWQPT